MWKDPLDCVQESHKPCSASSFVAPFPATRLTLLQDALSFRLSSVGHGGSKNCLAYALPFSMTIFDMICHFYAKLHDLCFQVELQSNTALTFPSSTTNSRTSSGTYLATATFTSGGNFLVVTQPVVNSGNNCGAFTSPQLQLAVLVAAVDYNVSCLLQISY